MVQQQQKLSLWARTCSVGFLYVWNDLAEVWRQAMGQGQGHSLLKCIDGNLLPALDPPEAASPELTCLAWR